MNRAAQDSSSVNAGRAAVLMLVALVYLYLILFVPLVSPINTSFGDDTQFLNEATRILDGQVIYRDFFDCGFAGTQLFYAGLIRLFGARAWIPNGCLLGLGIGLFCASAVISRHLMPEKVVFLPGLLFLCLAFRNYLDATHHWYSALIIMAAVAVLAKRSSDASRALSGALCGLALWFSPNHGALAAFGFALFTLWDSYTNRLSGRRLLQRELHLLWPFAVVSLAYVLYFAITAGPANLIYSTVVFPIKFYDKSPWTGWRFYVGLDVPRAFFHWQFRGLGHSIVIALLLPGVYAILARRLFLERGALPSKESRAAALLTLTGLCLFVSVANTANLARLSPVSLPGFILLVWLIRRTGPMAPRLQAFCWVVAFGLMSNDIWAAQWGWHARFTTPSGPTVITSSGRKAWYEWLSRNTHPGDYVFDTFSLGVDYAFHLKNPTKLPFLTNCDFTRPDQAAQAVRDLEEHRARVVVWTDILDHSSCPRSADHLSPLRDYLQGVYADAADFSDHDLKISMLVRIKTRAAGRNKSG